MKLWPFSKRATYEGETSIRHPNGWLVNALGGFGSSSGESVTTETAIRYATFASCVLVLSQTIGQFPKALYRRESERRKVIFRDHQLHRLIARKPNRDMTSSVMFSALMAGMAVHGKACAFISFDERGLARELIPLDPSQTYPHREGGRLTYRTRHRNSAGDTVNMELDPAEVLYVPWLTLDGINSYTPISILRETIGTGISAQKHAGRVFSKGGFLSGWVKHPAHFQDEDAAKKFSKSWHDNYSGADNAGKTAVLQDGMEYNPLTMPSADSQTIESQKLTRTNICGVMRVPLHMVADLDRANFSNVEQMDIGVAKYMALPHVTNFEQELNAKLIPEELQDELFFKFNMDGLLRGDLKTRATYYNQGIFGGWLNRNEVRDLEDRNQEDEDLDEFLAPVNMLVAGQQGEGAQDGGQSDTEPRADIRSAIVPHGTSTGIEACKDLLADAIARCVHRECEVTRKTLKAQGPDLINNLAGIATDQREYVTKHVGPVMGAIAKLARLDGELRTQQFVKRWTDFSTDSLALSLDNGDALATVDEWKADRARQTLETEYNLLLKAIP